MKLYNYISTHKQIYVAGDIHGNISSLVYKIHRDKITNAIIIVAGDCGFGFEEQSHYNQLYDNKLKNRLETQDCVILCVRGNHDCANYYEQELINFPHLKTIPDYSIVQIADKNILCVGGAISLDRSVRKESMEERKLKHKKVQEIYWNNEAPILDTTKVEELRSNNIFVDTLVTHTAPSICYPQSKESLYDWAREDSTLLDDVATERETMDSLWQALAINQHHITKWFYGHFHESHSEKVGSCNFTLLNINEIKPI